MKKKFLSILAIMFVILIGFTNVQAKENLFSFKAYTDIYKLSEQTNKIELPFFNYFINGANYDENVKHSGITFGQSTVDVNEKLEGVHVIFSQDMVTIKGEVENALIYGNNIVVEGKISGDTILMAPTVQILETATVSKDVVIVANDLDIKGNVVGNVIATVSNKATISGNIEKSLRMIATEVNVNSENIKGDIYIETDSDVTSVKEKYPNAVIEKLTVEQKVDWSGLIKQGVITVVIYSVFCYLITRKENNIARAAYNKFKQNATTGIIMSFAMIMLLVIMPIILLALAFVGFGLVTLPILTIQIAVMVLIWQTAMLIVGTTIFEALKNKLGKFKIPVIALIFILLFTLTQIPVIAFQANLAIYIIAIAIFATLVTKKLPKKETTSENK